MQLMWIFIFDYSDWVRSTQKLLSIVTDCTRKSPTSKRQVSTKLWRSMESKIVSLSWMMCKICSWRWYGSNCWSECSCRHAYLLLGWFGISAKHGGKFGGSTDIMLKRRQWNVLLLFFITCSHQTVVRKTMTQNIAYLEHWFPRKRNPQSNNPKFTNHEHNSHHANTATSNAYMKMLIIKALWTIHSSPTNATPEDIARVNNLTCLPYDLVVDSLGYW